MSTAKVQHYVPQFLLRNFGNGKKDQVWVYDKLTARSFPSNVKNVASESRFYDFEYQGKALSIEPWLAELEGQANIIIKEVLRADSVAMLTETQRVTLASFMAVQLVRTRTFREEWKVFPRMLREHLLSSGDQVGPGSQAEALIRDHTDNETKEQTARQIYTAPQTYAARFLDKGWILAATSRRTPFMVCDNPLARQNLIKRTGRGNLGLQTPGIELYLPLSPTRALAIWCSTVTEFIHRQAIILMANALPRAADAEYIIATSDALLHGGLINFTAENVENFNSLQVSWSERYVFSTSSEFGLVQSMIDEYPELKQGPRSVVREVTEA